MKKLMKILCYAACVLLSAFYVYVLYLGKHPHVSDTYRAYYIDHTISSWPGCENGREQK